MRYIPIYTLFLLFYSCTTSGQQPMENDTIPLDPSIRYGQLSNGFTYYLKPLDIASPQLNMRLIVRSGYSQHDPDQLNIGHFVEHMAFRATKNFPSGIKDSILMDSLDMNYMDVLAGTSRYFAQYDFKAPLQNPYALKKGLLWYKDLVGNALKMTTEEIDSERGVLVSEKILRGGNKENQVPYNMLRSKIDPGTRVVKSSIQQYIDHYRTVDPDVIRRFYRDWYRPDQSALVVVGKIQDVDSLEKMIQITFSDIESPQRKRKWMDPDSLYFNQSPQFATLARPPQDNDSLLNKEETEIYLLYRDQLTRKLLHSQEGMKRKLVWNLLSDALRERFGFLRQRYNSKFSIYNYYSNDYSSGIKSVGHVANVFGFYINSNIESEREAVESTVNLLKQFRDYGLMEDEWESMKKQQLQLMGKDYSKSANYWNKEITKHFVLGEPLPIEKNSFLRDWFSVISLQEINEEIKNLISDMPEDIGIIAPETSAILSMKESDIRSWIKEAWNASVQTYDPPKVPTQLISEQQLLSLQKKDYSDMGIRDTGAREIVLANGIKVVLAPNSGETGKIEVHGFSPIGARNFPEAEFFSAINAAEIVKNSGVDSLNKFDITRFLSSSQSSLSVHPYIKATETGIKCQGSTINMEELFQLIYLYFTKPRKDKEAFSDWKEFKYLEYYEFGSPIRDLNNTRKLLTGDPTMNNSGTTEMINGLSHVELDEAYNSYEALFGRTEDFIFLISGDFDIKDVLSMSQKYLGNIQNKTSAYLIDKNIQNTVALELENGPKLYKVPAPAYGVKNIEYALRYIVPEDFDWKEYIKVDILGKVLKHQLFQTLRNGGFAVYTPHASGQYNFDCARYEIYVSTSFSPEGTTDEKEKQFNIFREAIHNLSLSPLMFAQAKEQVRAKYASNKYFHNSNLQKRLYEKYKYNIPWLTQKEVEGFIASLTFKDVKQTAKKYLKKKHRYEFVMGKN